MNSVRNNLISDKMTCEKLPPEILLKIFRLVSREDLLKICLVSKKFLAIASSSVFWRELILSKNKIVKNNACEEFQSLTRFLTSLTTFWQYLTTLITITNTNFRNPALTTTTNV